MALNRPSLWLALAMLWGFAEATAFFVVPDVLLTAAVFVFGLVVALRFAFAAALAAMVGGLVMWRCGQADVEAARIFLMSVPLVGDDLLARVQREFAEFWPVNLTLGALTGAPYKIYAVEAGGAGVNPWAFAAVSIAARFARFALAILLMKAGAMVLERVTGLKAGLWFVGAVWGAIYLIYIALRLNA